jgi:hypothetical protein
MSVTAATQKDVPSVVVPAAVEVSRGGMSRPTTGLFYAVLIGSQLVWLAILGYLVYAYAVPLLM